MLMNGWRLSINQVSKKPIKLHLSLSLHKNCTMKPSRKLLAGLFSVTLLIILAWFFSDITWYILISAVLSFIGAPVVSFFDRLKFRGWSVPHGISTLMALLFIFLLLVVIFSLFVPLIVTEARVISSIDIQRLNEAMSQFSTSIESWLLSMKFIEPGQQIDDLLLAQLEPFMGMATFGNIFKNIVGFASSLLMGVFSILFITFFFLKDDRLFMRIILLFADESSERRVYGIIDRVKHLLSRYFQGICIQLGIMMLLLSLGLYLMGIPNALLIGVFGGLLNIIPYIGPIIGMVTGIILTALGYVALADYTLIMPAAIKVVAVFLVANLIDNIFSQPLIYSNSVKAHPLEIFLVIIMAGTMAGIVGMILAIPAYTVIRIVGSEFLGEFPVIGKLTRKSGGSDEIPPG
ncbi:MAG: AI-2E family transporter [Bacteroidetes bacterium HGW-Bacteroidetes-22]|nr:MAG: AI-2E family transporter [Bacteroidetes bacterium HGW-Bacteroidetes-22]